VLPSIRKTGAYGAVDPIKVLSDPTSMCGLLQRYSEKVIALEAANAELALKAEALDRIANADGSLNITEPAKALQIRPKDLFRHLPQHGCICKREGSANCSATKHTIRRAILSTATSDTALATQITKGVHTMDGPLILIRGGQPGADMASPALSADASPAPQLPPNLPPPPHGPKAGGGGLEYEPPYEFFPGRVRSWLSRRTAIRLAISSWFTWHQNPVSVMQHNKSSQV